MTEVKVRTPALPGAVSYEEAEEVYASALSDARIGFGEIEWLEDAGGKRSVEFEIDAADFDEAMMALARGRDQLGMRARFDELKERALKISSPRKTVVVNLYGGPGSGKTTAALEIAEKLKKAGYVVEYAPEYAKELVWQMNNAKAEPAQRALSAVLLNGSLTSQRQVYSTQLQRIWRCAGQCDFVVTDSPPALSALYLKPKSATERKSFEQTVMRDMAGFENFNMVVTRAGPYEREGRVHDEAEAAEIDRAVTRFLDSHGIYYGTYDRTRIDTAIRNAVRFHERVAGKDRGPGAQGAGRPGPGEEKGDAMEDRTAEARQDGAWVYMSVPKTSYKDKDSARELTVAGNPMVQITLPPHVPEVQTADGPVDVAFFTMLVPPQAVKAWPNDPNYYDVSFPAANRNGEPWMVNLQKGQGHWENPDGQTREEKGAWVKEEPVKVQVQATALAESMQSYRDGRREHARAQALAEGREWTEARQAAPQPAAQRRAVPDPSPARTQAASPAADAAAARSAASQARRAQPAQQAQARQGAIA